MTGRSNDELLRALADALRARDEALLALADARTELNSLRLRSFHLGNPDPEAWADTGREALPLRYQVADSVNDGLRAVLGPGHATAKTLLAWLRRR